jgi:hypothetical protein
MITSLWIYTIQIILATDAALLVPCHQTPAYECLLITLQLAYDIAATHISYDDDAHTSDVL